MPAFMDTDSKKKSKKQPNFDAFQATGDPADPVMLFEPDYVATMVFAIQEGKALRIGLTRDGGAICVALYDDGNVKNFYMRSAEEVAGFFKALYAHCKGEQ